MPLEIILLVVIIIGFAINLDLLNSRVKHLENEIKSLKR